MNILTYGIEHVSLDVNVAQSGKGESDGGECGYFCSHLISFRLSQDPDSFEPTIIPL